MSATTNFPCPADGQPCTSLGILPYSTCKQMCVDNDVKAPKELPRVAVADRSEQ